MQSDPMESAMISWHKSVLIWTANEDREEFSRSHLFKSGLKGHGFSHAVRVVYMLGFSR
jgi:hypothetical protein